MEEFFSKVEKTEKCWNWKGAKTGWKGLYGKFKNFYAHRYSFEMLKGPIPPGMVVDHICRNKKCVNPEHLRVVTPSVNSTENIVGHKWQQEKAQTHCLRGHEFNKENTEIEVTKRGGIKRKCKTCRSAARRRRYLNG